MFVDMTHSNPFFELIQVAMGQRECLEQGPSDEEWQQIHLMALRQGLQGICYRGIERLFDFGLRIPQDLSIDWMAAAESISEENQRLQQRCARLQRDMAAAKVRLSFLNEVGSLCFYPEELQPLCEPTVIDVFVDGSMNKVIGYAKKKSRKAVVYDYKFLTLKLGGGVKMRARGRAEMCANILRNRRLQKWLRRNHNYCFLTTDGLTRPTATMMAFLMMLHLQQCFLYDGITMRQLLDYYYVLRRLEGRFRPFRDGVTINQLFKTFGLTKFAQGMMWVMQEAFGLSKDYMPCEMSRSDGEYIIDVVMAGKRNYLSLLLKYPGDILWYPVWLTWHAIWRNV